MPYIFGYGKNTTIDTKAFQCNHGKVFLPRLHGLLKKNHGKEAKELPEL